jgi:hypothetical protein
MIELPEAPFRVHRLPIDERGYPVPWFVAWMKEGREVARGLPGAVPDFRILASGARDLAVRRRRCWICGETMGRHQVFIIGPMCSINRTSMEPPAHRDCAEYSAKACPFLTRPRQKRNEKGLADMPHRVDGDMIKRNPGCICLWESGYHVFMVREREWLLRLDDPRRVDWYAYGRQATRAEIMASIESGYPALLEPAERDGPEAVAELVRLRREAERYLPEREAA